MVRRQREPVVVARQPQGLGRHHRRSFHQVRRHLRGALPVVKEFEGKAPVVLQVTEPESESGARAGPEPEVEDTGPKSRTET